MDIEIGTIDSEVRAVDGTSLMEPAVKHQLMREMLVAVRDRESHAQRVRLERAVNAGRTNEEIA
jgi:hypothetical protein